MDDIVIAAMRKWPRVPHCYGWLGLDERGRWYMRDDRAQAAGAFTSGAPGAKGSLLRHEKLVDFIHRNYAADAEGCWYFQNGPQRVYVELEATPIVWRIEALDRVVAHTGRASGPVRRCLTDETGRVYLECTQGLGIVHPQDVIHVADALEAGCWPLEEIRRAQLPQLGPFVPSPASSSAARAGAVQGQRPDGAGPRADPAARGPAQSR